MPGKRKLARGTPSRATCYKKQKKKNSPVTKRRGARVPPHVIADRQTNATETESSLSESSDNELEVEDCTFPQISQQYKTSEFLITQYILPPHRKPAFMTRLGNMSLIKLKRKCGTERSSR